MPIDLSKIALRRSLAQCFMLKRSTGTFVLGGWQNNEVDVQGYGIVGIADAEALEQVPEGDRVLGSLQVIAQAPIYRTSEDRSGVSDKIVWNGELYRVISVEPWVYNGFYSAIIARMKGS